MWSAPQLDDMVDALRSGSDTDVLLDLSEVPFLDSMGLRALVQLHDVAASRGGVVTVVGETQPVRKALRVSGVNALLGVPDSDDEPSADVDLSLLHADASEM